MGDHRRQGVRLDILQSRRRFGGGEEDGHEKGSKFAKPRIELSPGSRTRMPRSLPTLQEGTVEVSGRMGGKKRKWDFDRKGQTGSGVGRYE